MNKKNLKYLLWILLAFLLIWCMVRLYFRLTHDFRVSNITHQMPHHQEWEIEPLTAENAKKIDAILNQKFHYIGKGAQSYAFVSDDGKYVLKFFKFKHLRPNWFVDSFPNIPPFSSYRDSQTIRKHRKLNGVFEGYHLGYSEDQLESGLLYIHLNTGNELRHTVTVYDKIGWERTIDLDKVPFILQEKAIPLSQMLDTLLSKNDISTAKLRIRQIFDLYLREYKKGLVDTDPGIMNNSGFVNDKPIHLDVGKMIKKESVKKPSKYEPDLEYLAWEVKQWLHKHHPDNENELSEDLSRHLSELFGRTFDFKTAERPVKIKMK